MQTDVIQGTEQYGVSIFIPDVIIMRERKNSFLQNLMITKIGYYNNSSGHFMRRSDIDEYILLYCVDGKGWIETKGIRKDVERGNVVFFNINNPHAYGADNKEPWCLYWAHFTGAGVPKLYDLLSVTPQSAIINLGVKHELIELFKKAYETLSAGYSLPNLLLSVTFIQEFLCYLIKDRMNVGNVGSSGADIKSIIDLMTLNIQGKYTLQGLSSHMNISKYHFCRQFKEATGYSPIEYFNRLKIQKACELLDTTSLKIKDISDYLSFSTPFYFSEVFKRIVGYSPKKYRTLQKVDR